MDQFRVDIKEIGDKLQIILDEVKVPKNTGLLPVWSSHIVGVQSSIVLRLTLSLLGVPLRQNLLQLILHASN